MTIKDFATRKGVTTQAIYKLIKNHAEALEGHIEKRGRVQWLDEYAQNYLSDRMNGNPIELADNSLRQRIAELERRVEQKDVIIERLQQREQEKDALLEQMKEEKLQLEESSQAVREQAAAQATEAQIQHQRADAAEQREQQLREQLEAERNRPLTFRERLFGRK